MAANLDYLNPGLIPLEEKVRAYLVTEKDLRQTTTAPNAASLHASLARLKAEIMALLPTRNQWVTVNLGYGPSRVGAWQVASTPDVFELRVVH